MVAIGRNDIDSPVTLGAVAARLHMPFRDPLSRALHADVPELLDQMWRAKVYIDQHSTTEVCQTKRYLYVESVTAIGSRRG